jgi:hypothetical protein
MEKQKYLSPNKIEELQAAREAHKRVQRQLVAKGPEIPQEQRPLLDAAMQEQRQYLIQQGFRDDLAEFMEGDPMSNDVVASDSNHRDLRLLHRNVQQEAKRQIGGAVNDGQWEHTGKSSVGVEARKRSLARGR